jgi:hypothetical protein
MLMLIITIKRKLFKIARDKKLGLPQDKIGRPPAQQSSMLAHEINCILVLAKSKYGIIKRQPVKFQLKVVCVN